MNYGYEFYFKDGSDVLTFPITPSELNIKVGSNNETVTLINEGDINILKSPSLIEVEFEARFPMRKYPYSREFEDFQTYFDKFKELKEQKKAFRFIVARTTPNGNRTWDTNLLVALEDFELQESADEGDDVLVTFNLKQYKEYGVTVLEVKESGASRPSQNPRPTDNKGTESSTYTVKSGDTLWGIAKKFYGKGSEWKKIYEANKDTIESTAKKHGKKSSSNGHWIYPGTKLIIPNASTGNVLATGSIKGSETNPTAPTGQSKHQVNITVKGNTAYAGNFTIQYYSNGVKCLAGGSTATMRVMVDANTTVTVTVTPKSDKTVSAGDMYGSPWISTWTSNGRKYSCKVKTTSGLTLTWAGSYAVVAEGGGSSGGQSDGGEGRKHYYRFTLVLNTEGGSDPISDYMNSATITYQFRGAQHTKTTSSKSTPITVDTGSTVKIKFNLVNQMVGIVSSGATDTSNYKLANPYVYVSDINKDTTMGILFV